ncbi:MAG: hypothetical protein ACT4OM_09590 [Actinomycetota bacterium]
MSHGHRGTCGTLGAAVLFVSAIAFPVESSAAVAVPVRPAPNLAWSIVPSPTGEVSEPEVTAVVETGETITSSVRLTVAGPDALTISLTPALGRTEPDGSFNLIPSTPNLFSHARITLAEQALTVAGGSFVDVAFTASVSPASGPGDLVAGILGTVARPDTVDSGRTLMRWQGVKVNLRVDGQIRPSLEVSGVRLRATESSNPVQPWDLEIDYLVTNTGNIRLGAKQTIGVRTLFADRSFEPAPLPDILPGQQVRMSFAAPNALYAGRGTVNVVLVPFPSFPGEVLTPLPPSASAAQSIWRFPWIALVELAVAGLLVRAALGIRRLRRRGAEETRLAQQQTLTRQLGLAANDVAVAEPNQKAGTRSPPG